MANNHPSSYVKSESKKINDAIILCFYSRLFEGMTEQEKKDYKLLLPTDDKFPTNFDYFT